MKEDPRIIKTLSKLQKAFVMLLKTYDAGDINVRQISDEAGVTRGAFYSHFSDKKEFVNFTINELVGSLFNSSLKDSVGFVDEVNHKMIMEPMYYQSPTFLIKLQQIIKRIRLY
ncbi:TetR/AcrR family transcriptional regulator [Pediococcus pentosaceus]